MAKQKLRLTAMALALAAMFSVFTGTIEARAQNGNGFYNDNYGGGQITYNDKGDTSVLPIGAEWQIADGYEAKIVAYDTRMFRLEIQGGKEVLVAVAPGSSIVRVRLPSGYEVNYSLRVMQPEGYVDKNGRAVVPDASQISSYPEEVLTLVNQERAKVGARPLRMADDLRAAADVRARELTVLYSHTRPDGRECFTAINTKNRVCGENIAAGQATPAEVMKSWMDSPGHRANILNAEFREIGVGYYASAQGGWGRYCA